eukprot:scaffold1954_cov364-Prasinococcus_capsulatus_cf.AAC.3
MPPARCSVSPYRSPRLAHGAACTRAGARSGWGTARARAQVPAAERDRPARSARGSPPPPPALIRRARSPLPPRPPEPPSIAGAKFAERPRALRRGGPASAARPPAASAARRRAGAQARRRARPPPAPSPLPLPCIACEGWQVGGYLLLPR